MENSTIFNRILMYLQLFGYFISDTADKVMAVQSNDTIYFLILWLVAMFVTLATGIFVIMYQVKCFPCQNNEVANDDATIRLQHQAEFQQSQLDPQNAKTCVVCGEVMSTEEEGEIHQSCHDVDVMCV